MEEDKIQITETEENDQHENNVSIDRKKIKKRIFIDSDENDSKEDENSKSSVHTLGDEYQIEPYDFSALPKERCEYCGIHDPNYIVK